jgi:hypothetical protein
MADPDLSTTVPEKFPVAWPERAGETESAIVQANSRTNILDLMNEHPFRRTWLRRLPLHNPKYASLQAGGKASKDFRELFLVRDARVKAFERERSPVQARGTRRGNDFSANARIRTNINSCQDVPPLAAVSVG